jgi:hypothetical protein
VEQLIEAPRYKPEDLGFDYGQCYWILHLHNFYGCAVALGSTKLLTEMRTSSKSFGVKS